MKKIWLTTAISILFSGMAYSAPEQSYVNMASMLLEQDYKVFISAGGSVLGKDVTEPMTASELIAMYEKNELSANKKLKGKFVRIKSKASEIGENATGQAYIRIDGKNQFQNIMLYVDGNDEKILNLEKGAKVDFICRMDKYIMHTPFLKQCTFTSDFGKQRKEAALKSVTDDKITSQYQALLVAMYNVNKDVFSASCTKPDENCIKALTETAKSKERVDKTKAEAVKIGKENNLPDFVMK